jgi:hypothetical protein
MAFSSKHGKNADTRPDRLVVGWFLAQFKVLFDAGEKCLKETTDEIGGNARRVGRT